MIHFVKCRINMPTVYTKIVTFPQEIAPFRVWRNDVSPQILHYNFCFYKIRRNGGMKPVHFKT